jgi:3-hydroxyisobutyrate dehydrogenase-like beta-hydroxyacid dehydrogenase
VLKVYTDDGGIIANAKDGLICIEMTSAMGATMKKISEFAKKKGADITFVDAPVSGGVAGAEQGTLTIMQGGEKDDIQKVRPYLEAMGSKLIYAGKLGDGKSVKMLNQMLNALNTAVAAEAIYLAQSLGIDSDILLDIVRNSSGGSWVINNNIKKFMIEKLYDKGFKLELMTKDLRLSVQEARQQGISLPITKQVLDEYEQTLEDFGGNVNYNAVGEWINKHNRRI